MPSFAGVDSVLLATGILGATVIPHVIYLHSDLTRSRRFLALPGGRAGALRAQRLDVLIALGLAGLANAAMLIIAARLFFGSGLPGTDTIEGVHAGLARLIDAPAALAAFVAVRGAPQIVFSRLERRWALRPQRRPGDVGEYGRRNDPEANGRTRQRTGRPDRD